MRRDVWARPQDFLCFISHTMNVKLSGLFLKMQAAGALALALLLSTALQPVSAQSEPVWTPQEQIPFYTDEWPPLMIADRDRTVHAFNVESSEGTNKVIYYRQWSLSQGWSRPSDILIIDRAATRRPLLGAVADGTGRFHLVYYLDEAAGGLIMHTAAPMVQANRAPAWSPARPIVQDADAVASAALLSDGLGRLVLVYSGQALGAGVYSTYSTDGGLTWSSPVAVFLAFGPNRSPYAIRLATGEAGRIHAVWSVVNERGVGDYVFYARSEPDLSAWNKPVQLAAREGDDYSANWPAIAAFRDDLIVVYQDSFPATLWTTRSRDGGLTWSAPVRPFPHVGEAETPALLVDGAGVLHMLHGARIGNPAVYGMWHSVWLGDRWGDFKPVISWQGNEITYRGRVVPFGPSAPQAVISQGNVLLAAWRHDVRESTPATYSYAVLAAPELPVQTPPAPAPTPTPATLDAVATAAAPTRTPIPDLTSETSDDVLSSPALPLVAGLAPVLAVVAIVFVARLARKPRR